MKTTKYSTYIDEGKKFLQFENIEKNIFGRKKIVKRFIPTKHFYGEDGERVEGWKLSTFPKVLNDYDRRVCISGEDIDKYYFINKYPDINEYLIELNLFLKSY